MRSLFAVCLLISSLGSPVDSLADTGFPGIKALMTDAERQTSGVETLTTAQIDALNQWLIRYTANEADLIKKTDAVKQETFQVINSHVVGPFNGWSGNTQFHLENGQIWQQRYSSKWRTKLDSPAVVITRNSLGFYNLEVVDKGRRIGVKRIQ